MVPVVPFLVTDGMEARAIAMVMSWASNHPCWICKIALRSMNDPKATAEHRRASEIERLQDLARQDAPRRTRTGANTRADQRDQARAALNAQSVHRDVEVRWNTFSRRRQESDLASLTRG